MEKLEEQLVLAKGGDPKANKGTEEYLVQMRTNADEELEVDGKKFKSLSPDEAKRLKRLLTLETIKANNTLASTQK